MNISEYLAADLKMWHFRPRQATHSQARQGPSTRGSQSLLGTFITVTTLCSQLECHENMSIKRSKTFLSYFVIRDPFPFVSFSYQRISLLVLVLEVDKVKVDIKTEAKHRFKSKCFLWNSLYADEWVKVPIFETLRSIGEVWHLIIRSPLSHLR